MRVTNNMIFNAGVGALQSQQQDMMRLQEETATGMKINRPSDDPSGTFRHMLFSSNLSEVQSLKRTSSLAAQRLSTGDISIGEIHESMLQAQDLVMRYSHSSVGGDPDTLRFFTTEVSSLYDNVLAVVNTELDGVPVFGGGRTHRPFDESRLAATPVRFQENGAGRMVDPPTWYQSSAGISEFGFSPPADQEEGATTEIWISYQAGEYEVDINGAREPAPISVTSGESGEPDYLDLGNGVLFTLGSTPREGDRFSFNVTQEDGYYRTSNVRREGSDIASSVTVSGAFQTPDGQEAEDATAYTLLVNHGQFEATVNGVPQGEPLAVTHEAGRPSYVDLGNGVHFNLGEVPKEGDLFSFHVVPTTFGYGGSVVQTQRHGGIVDRSQSYAGFTASVADDHTLSDLPLSVKVSFLAANQEYLVDINGVEQPPQRATPGPPASLDLGRGLSFNIIGKPQTGDTFYFEVVPEYRGGAQDRPIQVLDGQTLPANVTGAELIEGAGRLGRDVNILGALAALRGAVMRADPEEVASQLDRVRGGGEQVSNFQAITGVRAVQVEATNAILASDELMIQEAQANNSEVDLFALMSQLQQVSQAMEMMATAERKVLNTSLIDFIR